jgi:hypothetical protein
VIADGLASATSSGATNTRVNSYLEDLDGNIDNALRQQSVFPKLLVNNFSFNTEGTITPFLTSLS